MGDQTRIFNTLATIIVLLEPGGRPDDIILLDEGISRHEAGHGDPRIRRRQTRIVAGAEHQLDRGTVREARAAGRAAPLTELIVTARRALADLPED